MRPRAGLPQHRRSISLSRFSIDSDDALSVAGSSDMGSPPQVGRGLAPPPLNTRRAPSFSRATLMPTIPGSPTDETEMDGISPVLSRAPPAPAPLRVITNINAQTLAPPNFANVPKAAQSLSPPSSSSPADADAIPAEHKRIPGLLPRSPQELLSPIRGFMARKGVRKAVPPPIIVSSPRSWRAKIGEASPALESVAIGTPPTATTPKPKRKTVWDSLIEGWWDLGLVGRVNTIKRRK